MNIILSSYSTMYWITASDAIITACIFLTVVSFIIFLVLLFGLLNDEYGNRYKPIVIISGIIAVITLLIAIFLPSERQWYKIYGIGGTIEYVKNNPKAQQLSNKITDTLYLGKNTKIIKVK